jgi:hypothetical protein
VAGHQDVADVPSAEQELGFQGASVTKPRAE